MSTLQTVKDAANWALVLNYGDSDQAVISSLYNVQLSGVSRDPIDVIAFGEEPRQKAGSKKRSNCIFSGYSVLSDPGQKILKDYLDSNTEFGPVGHANGHARMYYNLPRSTAALLAANLLVEDFRTLDTYNDSLGVYKFAGFTPDAADVNGIFSFSSGIMVGGREADFYAHITGTTIAIVDGSPSTITDSGNGFLDAGFEDGMTIIIEGSTADDGIYKIATAVAGTLTLEAGIEFTGELAAANTLTIHGGK